MFIYQSQNTYTLFNSAAFVVPKINADSDERHFYYLTGNTLLDFNYFFFNHNNVFWNLQIVIGQSNHSHTNFSHTTLIYNAAL